MKNSWYEAVLQILANAGTLGQESADFIRSRKVRIRFQPYSKSTGARWFLFRNIALNTQYYSSKTALDDPGMLSLLVHEVHHLKQCMWIALSVYGELDAWQVGFRFMKSLRVGNLHPAVEELLSLPLDYDRANLQRASRLMQDYAGKGYHINWLPLYPLHKEVGYWLLKRKPISTHF